MTGPAAAVRRRTTHLAAACVAVLAGGVASGAPEEYGQLGPTVATDRVLSGTWMLEQDLEVAKGATLHLSPGTRILVSRKDAGRAGLFPLRCEVRVHGRIVADGTAEAPVVFDAAPGADRPQSWHGIVLRSDRDQAPDSVFQHVRIRGAVEGISLADGAPRIERCAFDSCRLGVSNGRIWDAQEQVADESDRPRPEIVECLFVRCGTGVFVELGAAPAVARSSFVGNRCGVGNYRRSAFTFPIRGLGVRADRCWFSRNDVAVEGASVVENSIFTGNGAVLQTTAFHSTFSQDTDWIAWRRNAFHGNGCVTDGEADVGSENYRVDPGFAAPADEPPAFERLAVPQPGLGLAEDSLLRGAATDGGDCGPAGRAPQGRRRRVWRSSQRALRTALVLGPPERVDAKRLPKEAPANAGESCGDAWWVVADTDDGGGVVRSDVPFATRAETLPMAYLWRPTDAGPPTELELNADGFVAVWRDGRSLPVSGRELRSGSRGVLAPLVPEGAPGAVVWWRSEEIDARLGVAILGPGRALDGCEPPDDGPEPLDAESIRFGPRQAGIRFRQRYHWGDLRRGGVITVRAADGESYDAVQLAPHVNDAKGTVRLDLPASLSKAGATFVVDGLTDPWGRPFPGQPVEIPLEP